MIVSLPAPPLTVSLPARALIVSLPAVPFSVLLPVVAPGSSAPAVARVKSLMSMAALPTPLTWIVPIVARLRIPDGERVLPPPTALSMYPRGEVGRGDAEPLRSIRSWVAGVPPAASKLLMMSLPKLAAL